MLLVLLLLLLLFCMLLKHHMISLLPQLKRNERTDHLRINVILSAVLQLFYTALHCTALLVLVGSTICYHHRQAAVCFILSPFLPFVGSLSPMRCMHACSGWGNKIPYFDSQKKTLFSFSFSTWVWEMEEGTGPPPALSVWTERLKNRSQIIHTLFWFFCKNISL